VHPSRRATVAEVCDTLVSLTQDGVLFAKNSDRDPNEAQVVRRFDAERHEPGDVRCTWISIPQVAHTNAVVLSQPWWMWGAEMGANEHGVVIGNEAVFTNQPLGEPALLGMDLLRLALERAATATDAVGVIVELLERHGQGGPCSHERPGFSYHNSFLVADPTGAIVLETAGERWATEDVTGRGRSISNGLSIPGFAERYTAATELRAASCLARRARTQPAAEHARDVADLFAALRDHGPGTRAPRWSVDDGALAAPCVHAGGRVTSAQSTASWVSDLRDEPLHWVTATSAPCTSVFHPVRTDQPIDARTVFGPDPTNRFDAASRWWRHERFHRLVLRDHAASLGRFAAARDALEHRWLERPPATADAFAESAAAEASWLADLVAADLAETRPEWLCSLWRALDESAGLVVD
jgi:dipeptidase